ncbi:hypothetical protein FNF31_07351 [Cafeteria roenbergensis]|uniref:Uncharacterized protein n=1 Tax=Cafeteria roenbergensis TaxID=33653 RepID=A0A5A8C6K5_CAFRO|nr:hypothetical protein FNF31_07351 [Cafeteria roenbergensis]KAA0157783.1 hypothetical protein FNF28_06492 [Cafeteria roenbergensis]
MADSPSGWSASGDEPAAPPRDAAAAAAADSARVGAAALAAIEANPVCSLAAHGGDPVRTAASLRRTLLHRRAEARVCLREEYLRAGLGGLPVAFGGDAPTPPPGKRVRSASSVKERSSKRAARSSSSGGGPGSGGPQEAAQIATSAVRKVVEGSGSEVPRQVMSSDNAKRALGRAVALAARGEYKAGRVRGGSTGFQDFCRALTRAGYAALPRAKEGGVVAGEEILTLAAGRMVADFFSARREFRA